MVIAMIADLITRLGGATAVARALGVTDYSTVASWARRGSIPVAYWPGLIALGRERGEEVSPALLLAAHTATGNGATETNANHETAREAAR